MVALIYFEEKLVERNSAELAPEVAPSKPIPPVLAQPDQAQQDKHPTETIPSTPATPSMPQAVFTDPPATPPISPVAHSPSQDFITIFGSEFCGMHTAILSQIQQHLGLPPPQTDIPGPLELRAPAEETIPAEETVTADVPPQATHETTPKPSCPPENPAL
uniref:Uncharacterized protein n=1 Tax=Vitis vinifera TaxID=29760 RepID=A5BH56_VITVI|nr:hypothetical protein VITISV_030037 [Vitis vinifera]